MILTPAQNIIANDKHRFRVVNCGRRFGKTTYAIEEIKGRAISRPSRIAYFATTFAQAHDIAWEMLRKEMLPITINANETRMELRVKTLVGGESIIQLRGWESVETARGQKFDLLIPDEIASYRNWLSNWQEVLRPTLTDTKGEALFLSTPKGFNHFYDLFNLEQTDSDYKSFHFTSFDNPHLPMEEIEKARKELTEDRFAQEYLADFRKTEGLVYKEFNRAIHLVAPNDIYNRLRETTEYIAGIDFGFTNPTAVIHIKRDYDNTLWVVDEWYKREMTDAMVAEYVAGCKFNAVYPDPEAPAAIKELKSRGVNIREVIKNKDSIKNGINKIREMFKTGKLLISTQCPNLIYELETYSYPEKKDQRNENELPIKDNDHALDALRYALSMTASTARPQAVTYIPKNLKR
jgi:hypothetical protein